MLSAVISDWDDDKSVQILTNCRRAIAPGGRLLLIERRLVPEEPASPMAFLDLMMLVVGGGTGRSEVEYRRLLAEAGFELIHDEDRREHL
ncbi:MAG TPA: methyltransferase [Ktedonobacteraceae bacterium]|nr:methyltransferase [Ktedonobacteraceae bacterium]